MLSTLNSYALSFKASCGITLRAILLPLTVLFLANLLAAQTDRRALEPGKTTAREIAGGQTHSYSVTLASGQFLSLEVEQRGIDIVLKFTGPSGEKLAVVDLQTDTLGIERVWWEARKTGIYHLEVSAVPAKAAAGKYVLRTTVKDAPTGPDRDSQRGELLLIEAKGLVQEGSAQSLRRAIEKREQALKLWRQAGDRYWEAHALYDIGSVYDDLGEKQKALEYYNLALPLERSVGDLVGEARTLNSLGNTFDDLGEKQKALEFYNLALPLRRAIGDRAGQGATLSNIGGVYDDLGEKQKALEFYNLALPLERAVGDRRSETITLTNIGSVYDDLGDKQKALEFYNLALPLERAIGDRGVEALTLNNIGVVYRDLGENQKALAFYNLALPLERAVGDRRVEADTLNNIGSAYRELGQKQKALQYYNLALPLRRAVGDRLGEADTLNNIGVVYGDLGEKRKALAFYNLALPLKRTVGDRRGEAETLNNIGRAYSALGDRAKALEFYNLALPLRRAVSDRPGEAATLYELARFERDRNNLPEAQRNIEATLAIIEALRAGYTNQQLRSAYFATVQDYYEFYIDLLMRLHKQRPNAGHNGEALQISERARARALLETLAEANADIRQGVDPRLVERERALQQRLNARAQAQMKLLYDPHREEETRAIAQEIEALTSDLQQVETEIRQTSPRYAALTQPQPLTLKEIQSRVLDADTLLLEYSLGTDRSYLWAITPISIMSYELPRRDEIEAVARQVYAQLSGKPNADAAALAALRSGKKPRTETNQPKTRAQAAAAQLKSEAARPPSSSDAATRLSQMLLGPVAAQLGNKRLLIVADGALQYIPFGALPLVSSQPAVIKNNAQTNDKGKLTDNYLPLVIEHEIVSLPSASTLAVLRQEVQDRKPAARTVAVLADPVFESDDERVRRATGEKPSTPSDKRARAENRGLGLELAAAESGLKGAELKIPRLPGTREEAKQILSLVPPAQSKGAFDFAASRQTATSSELSEYRYVHFATHGFLDSVHPELSGIVLSTIDERGNPQDGFVRAHEIFNLKLPAELVVLSACQTGLGKEVKGEGVVSLTRGFMYAGAPRVVVSLWSVNDQATAELMARFYRGMLKDKLRPAAALRLAQIALMKEKGWQSPFYWAAFTLQGEWR